MSLEIKVSTYREINKNVHIFGKQQTLSTYDRLQYCSTWPGAGRIS